MKGNFKATLNFTSRQANRFDQSHLAFLQGIAEQIALALHALLTEQTQQERERRLINLLRISASLLWTHSVDEIARALDEGVRKLEAFPHFSLFIRFPDGTVQEAINTPEGVQWRQPSWLPQPLKPNETILGDILLGLRAVFVSNDPLREVSELERRQWEQVLGGQVFPFGNAVVPMQGHTGVVGAIAIDFRETRRFLSLQDEIVQLLIMLGNLAGLALENLWLQKQVEQQLAEVRLLNDLILQASAGVDWREMAQSLVNALPQVLPCDTVSVSLLSDDGKFLELVAAYPAPPPQFPLGFRLPIEKGIMGYVARTGEPVLERDVRTNPYYFAGREGTLSELCVPIKRGDLVIGVINLESNRLGAFHEGHLAFLQTLAAQLSSVMERAQLLRRQSELLQQLTAIFDSVQEGIVLVLPDGRLDDMNRRFGDLLGIPAEQLRYQPVETLRQALMRRAADPPAMLEAINAALADLNQPQYDLLTLTDPDQLLERYCVPVRLEDGTLMGQLWVLRDVTEEYRRQQESLRLERLRTLGELASGIAHDLNNALAPLLGGAELLRGHPDPEVNSIAESMLNMIHYAVGVVRRLQAFYRQTTAVALTTTEVSALLQDAITLTRSRWRDEALAEGVQIRLDTEFIEGLQVRGDVTALRQAFINILLNAADAIMERAKLTGDRQGTIALRMERIGNQVLVHITDDGIGMPEEVQRRVFETFFTTKGERGEWLGHEHGVGCRRRPWRSNLPAKRTDERDDRHRHFAPSHRPATDSNSSPYSAPLAFPAHLGRGRPTACPSNRRHPTGTLRAKSPDGFRRLDGVGHPSAGTGGFAHHRPQHAIHERHRTGASGAGIPPDLAHRPDDRLGRNYPPRRFIRLWHPPRPHQTCHPANLARHLAPSGRTSPRRSRTAHPLTACHFPTCRFADCRPARRFCLPSWLPFMS
jgi:two-component system NtrC family sensor kinase